MDTLLVVEDEKMIRRGICVMAQRSSVNIGEILECRNGMEAMEILKSRKIDTVFTDIRMPKMDGITLVKEMEDLSYKPDVVVVSGYDDFNYAVEMLKHGVADYILKPVKREKIEGILQKLEERQKSSSEEQHMQEQMLYSQIRYFLTSELPETEWGVIEGQWRIWFQTEPYVAVVFSDRKEEPLEAENQGICIAHVGQQKVRFLSLAQYEKWKQAVGEYFYGESLPIKGLEGCKKAYEQAKQAREKAFVQGLSSCVFEEEKSSDGKEEEIFAEQLALQFSGAAREEAVKNLLNLCFQARHQEILPWKMLSVIRIFLKKLTELYGNVMQEKKTFACEEPLLWDSLEKYETCLKEWLEEFSNCLTEQFLNHQNEKKIQEAVAYIHENFRKDLNMAMVSNYVSMNYSLFSLAFKSVTGVNFVNYLKDIRIKEAKRLLEETEYKVQEIGKMVGYENDKHFMKLFKSTCGISPSEYRKSSDNFLRKY